MPNESPNDFGVTNGDVDSVGFATFASGFNADLASTLVFVAVFFFAGAFFEGFLFCVIGQH